MNRQSHSHVGALLSKPALFHTHYQHHTATLEPCILGDLPFQERSVGTTWQRYLVILLYSIDTILQTSTSSTFWVGYSSLFGYPPP